MKTIYEACDGTRFEKARTCKDYETKLLAAVPEFNRHRSLPWGRYIAALRRFRDRIAAGLELRGVDSNAPGDKYTECTWGLCSDEKASWPDAEDHIWPRQFVAFDRVAPVYRGGYDARICPLDQVQDPKMHGQGCFYSCRVFRPKPRGAAVPTRDEALALYDASIAKAEAALAAGAAPPDELCTLGATQ